MLPLILGALSAGSGIASMLRKPQQNGYSKGDLEAFTAQRAGEIENFKNELASTRNKFQAQNTSFGNNTFNRFMPNAEAAYGGRGLSVTGGAFQSALARRAAEIQDQNITSLFNMEHSDVGSVDNARANLFSSRMSAQPQGPSPDQTAQGLGFLSSGLASAAAGWGNSPSTPAAGSAPVSSWGNFANMARKSVFSGQPYNKMNLGYR